MWLAGIFWCLTTFCSFFSPEKTTYPGSFLTFWTVQKSYLRGYLPDYSPLYGPRIKHDSTFRLCSVLLSYSQLIPRMPNSQFQVSFSLHQVDPIRQMRKSQRAFLRSLLEAGCSRAELRFASLCAALPQSQGISVEVPVTKYPSWLLCFPPSFSPTLQMTQLKPREAECGSKRNLNRGTEEVTVHAQFGGSGYN